MQKKKKRLCQFTPTFTCYAKRWLLAALGAEFVQPERHCVGDGDGFLPCVCPDFGYLNLWTEISAPDSPLRKRELTLLILCLL